jgi:hypothetical protein
MNGIVEKLKLKERAEEDIYFAKRDRELIAAMNRGVAVSLARSRQPGSRPTGNSTQQCNSLASAVRNYIRKICPECHDIVKA